jgi:pyruvate kinase
MFRFVRNTPAEANELTCSYERLVDDLAMYDRILLADGTVEMQVVEKSVDAVTCRVTNPGSLRSRQGINLPGVKLSLPAMSDVDRANALWAAEQAVDFVSLSFVRSAADIRQLRDLLRQQSSPTLAIAKIEKPEALADLEAIVHAADGIMIARGDLGVEIDVAEMPVRQKQIVDTCQRWNKPVIVATQMLDSMQYNIRPTRAEVTDVANAILDGVDACMLSGETAIGQYPVESVQMMNRIMLSTERSLNQLQSRRLWETANDDAVHPITSAVVAAAGKIADRLGAKIVVIATRSGRTALAKAKQRNLVPSIAVSDRQATLRQMCLYWGIYPLSGAPLDLDRELIGFVDRWGRQNGLLQAEDVVVFVAGTHIRAGAHNQLFVHQVE